ncbi:Translation elongation factor, partial [Thalictrum thalictroides]
MLREEVSKLMNCKTSSVKLISAGKILKDLKEKEKLVDWGIKNNTKILVSQVCADERNPLNQELIFNEEQCHRLARIKTAATALGERHSDSSLPVEDFLLELEDQSGKKIHLGSKTDHQGLMMGLMLHAQAKHLIKKRMFKDALEVLAMGE